MTAYLVDADVVIALTVREHEHHDLAAEWFGTAARCALCPIVEGALLRFLVRIGERPAVASALLARLHEHPRVEFWPDDVSYCDVNLDDLQGHRQITDAYLVGLAQRRGAVLATLDARLFAHRPEGVHLIGGD